MGSSSTTGLLVCEYIMVGGCKCGDDALDWLVLEVERAGQIWKELECVS